MTSDESSDSEEHISKKDLLKRLHKIERKLHRAKRRKNSSRERERRRPSRSRSRSSRRQNVPSTRSPERDDRMPRHAESRNNSADRNSQISASVLTLDDHNLRDMASNENDHASTVNNDDASPILDIDNDFVLPDDILNILGADPQENQQVHFNLHPALVTRWSHILINGLDANEKIKILDKYTLPPNCEAMSPPITNPEIVNILSNPHLKRDKSLSDQQNQLSKGITALAKGLQILLDEKDFVSKDKVVECLADSGRILSDLNYTISSVRRSLILPSLSKSVKETVEKTKPLGFLFGAELGEKVKEAKNFEKTGKDLKAPANSFLPRKKTEFYHNKFTTKERGGRTASSSGGSLNQYRPVRRYREAMKPSQGRLSNADKHQHYRKRK